MQGWVSYVLLICAILCLIIGLILSPNGTNAGLTNIVGQDLELFRKTKDRGFVKLLQIFMFIITFILIGLCIYGQVTGSY